MGKISRLKSITMFKIEAFLAALESPEDVLPQLVKEMSEKVNEAANAESKALSAVRAEQRRLDALIGKIERFRKGAQLALKVNDSDTARQAIAAQLDAEKQADFYRDKLNTCEFAYKSASDVRKKLQEQLKELKFNQKNLLIRVEQIRNREKNHKVNSSFHSNTNDILETVAKLEGNVDEQEAMIEIQDEITQTLGSTFEHERARELEKDVEVDRRLEKLKNQMDLP